MEYHYDALNRLVKVVRASDDATIAEYVYDGLGRRVLKVLTADDTRFIYDGGNVIGEYNANDALVCRYILGASIDRPLRMERVIGAETRTFYYHTNPLGTIVALTEWDSGEETETLVERYTYDAYGRLLVHTPGADGEFETSDDDYRSTSSVANPYGFTARALDTETGLMYYRARYYSTTSGRFIARDPAGYKDGLNLYQYARSSPLNLIDPDGRTARVTVDEATCTITITVDIGIYGADASVSLASTIEQSIKANWNGKKTKKGCKTGDPGDCKVKVEANVWWYPNAEHWWDVDEDNKIKFTGETDRSWVLGPGGSYGRWDSTPPYGGWEYAHEAGHLMGLWDDYNYLDPSNPPNKGHENCMMGARYGQVAQHEIDSALGGAECPKVCCCPPKK